MEDICFALRFPDIGENILIHLDPTSLRVVKQCSKSICAFVESVRLYWIRLILKRFDSDDLPQPWQQLLVNTPISMLKMIVMETVKFSEIEPQIAYFGYQKILNGQLCRDVTPLHIAAATGNSKLTSYIIERFGYVQIARNGETPLHMAARMGHLDAYKIMAQNFANINPGNQFGDTPFHVAASRGHFEICKYLFAMVPVKNPKRRPFGRLPLGIAYANDHMLIFLHIYKQSDDKNPETNWISGNTLLHDAILKEDVGIYKFICKNLNQENKNPPNNNGETPLHLAAKVGNFQLFHLIHESTDIKNPFDRDGKTPLDNAESYSAQDNEARRVGKARIFSEFN